MFALFDHLEIGACKGVGVSGGGNVLLHLATRQPERIKAMVLVSATPYFPAPARPIMSQYPDSLPEEQREFLRRRHSGGDPQVRAILESTRSFATSYDDMNFIVQGDRDPLYPVELSVEMAKAIPQSQLWILPNAGHGPVFGEKWPDFQKTAAAFLRG
jgi:pimeloyl-ACP methyl ester carboxylesterase